MSSDAGPDRTAARVLLLLVFIGFAVLFAARGQWFLAVVMLVASASAIAALVKGQAL
jgi:uncharacterized membrane protein